MQKVDVAVNVYGKPYQTAVTLYSLLKHSGKWIDKIYFIEERKQPHSCNFEFLKESLKEKIVHYTPKHWFWTNRVFKLLTYIPSYRYAIRYQYAWEKTDKKYLLVIHNDLLVHDDIVGAYLNNIGDHTGIGSVGQCWNCPAFHAQKCDGNRYLSYRPSEMELNELVAKYPAARAHMYKEVMANKEAWPLPECRLNEYIALINMDKARPVTRPHGKVMPFGSMNWLDVGSEWFWELNQQGHTFTHFDYDQYVTHSWVSQQNSGHSALFDQNLYLKEEEVALQLLTEEYSEWQ